MLCGQLLLLFPCLICRMTMCVPEHKYYARKCSEAERLKDLLQHKCSPTHCKSDRWALHATLTHFVSVRLKDFLPYCPLNTFSSRSTNQNVLPSGPKLAHWTVASFNERFVVVSHHCQQGSFSLLPDNDPLLVCVSCEDGEGTEREQKACECVSGNE